MSLAISIVSLLVVCVRKGVRWGIDIPDAVDAGGVALATVGSLLILKGIWLLISSAFGVVSS